MKKQLVIIGIVTLFATIGLNGCEELEKLNTPDYIEVHVVCSACLYVQKEDGLYYINDALVRIESIKAGGEKESEIFKTEIAGNTDRLMVTFKLYKEQPITCIATVILSSVDQYSDYTFNSASSTKPWSYFYPAHDFGDSVTLYEDLKIIGTKN